MTLHGSREGCCAGRRKPCPYHEGWADAMDHQSVHLGAMSVDVYRKGELVAVVPVEGISRVRTGDYASLRDDALLEMQAWLQGRKSMTNLGPHPPYTPDVIAVIDAQEVVKWATAATTYNTLASGKAT